MSKPRPVKPAEVMRVLEKMGFRLIRQSGSHAVYRHPDGALDDGAYSPWEGCG